jgi:uncharacterized protein involved in response to NO
MGSAVHRLAVRRERVLANRRNVFFVVLVLALGAAGLSFYAWPRYALTVGLDVVLFVMVAVAGRVVPMFTNNAVPGAGARRLPAIELGALGSVSLLLVMDVFGLGIAAAVVAATPETTSKPAVPRSTTCTTIHAYERCRIVLARPRLDGKPG